VTDRLAITGGRILHGDDLVDADLLIADGKIAAIRTGEPIPAADRTIDADGLVVLPGLIDTHLHAREPGYTHKEDFTTASTAAAAGGVTMFVDMPNTDPPPDTLERFLEHRSLAEAKAVIDFNHWAMPTVISEIPKIAEAGAFGFKFFMKSAHYPYGDDISIVDHGRILETFRAIAATGKRCVVHPHNQDIWELKTAEWTTQGRTTPADWNAVTYGDADIIETTPIALLAILADAVGVDLRILHIQGRPQLRVVRMMKAAGFGFTAEANPWGVFRIDPLAIQTPADVEANWEALRDGTIDLIASDHAPHTRDEQTDAEQQNAFQSVIAAYPLAEHYLSLYLTEVAKGRLTLRRLVELVSENPARHLGLYPAKGAIGVGSDADLVLVDLDAEAVLGDSYPVYSKMGFTPLAGRRVKGRPVYTIVRGQVVMEYGQLQVKPGFGRFVPAAGP
jgi:dihydroorotase (multifunctional complex type)